MYVCASIIKNYVPKLGAKLGMNVALHHIAALGVERCCRNVKWIAPSMIGQWILIIGINRSLSMQQFKSRLHALCGFQDTIVY